MFRRFLFLSVGTLALLVALEAPGQLHAQGMRGGVHPGFRMGMMPGFRMGMTPGFRGTLHSRFNRGFFNPRFDSRFGLGRFDRFEDRLQGRFPFSRFDRFEDRANRAFFNPFFAP
jgi:hypothetical protein